MDVLLAVPKKDGSKHELDFFLSQDKADLYIFPEGFLDSNALQEAVDIIREKEKYVITGFKDLSSSGQHKALVIDNGKIVDYLWRNAMKEIIAYEMLFKKEIEYSDEVLCVPFQKEYWNEYMQKYNECFGKMRKDLEIEPINYYSSYSQMIDKASNTYLCLKDGVIAGAVSCYENEIDDLFVDKAFQRQGLGRKLLLWGINHIKKRGYDEIILHVAEWNQNAVKLYLETGFAIQKKERVR